MPRREQGALKQLFSVCFFLFWCIFTLTVCQSLRLPKNLAALVLLGLFLLAGGALAGPVDRMSPRAFRTLFFALLCAAFAVCFWLAYRMRIHLPTDTDIIFTSVADILRDGKLDEANPRIDANYFPGLKLYTNNDYFCRYPNNIGLLMLYVGLYAVCGPFGFEAGTDAGQAPAIFLTALAVAVTVFFLCCCARLLLRCNSSVLYTLLLSYAFLPFVFGVPNFYTDLWVIFFTVAGVYCYLRGTRRDTLRLWLPFVGGILLAVGIQMKPTAAVAVVAIGIESLITPPWGARRFAPLLALLSGVLLFTGGFVFLYFSNLLAGGLALLRKKVDAVFLCDLTVFGLILFLMLFENGARRAMLAAPFLILNAVFLQKELGKGSGNFHGKGSASPPFPVNMD